ncbi:MAG: fatty acid desaturase family protein [Hyphomicrobiaceae bacterium]
MAKRDYSLLGPDAQVAVANGLANSDWYKTDLSRQDLKQLMQRSDQPAIRDTCILFGSMIVFAGLGIALWPSWWSAPFWLAYGVLYGSATDSRWHECGHGTAFKTRWMNDVVYQIACFMIFRNPVVWRYGHSRHHTDTTIVGRDPQIAAMRPPNLRKMVLNLVGIMDFYEAWRLMLQLSFGWMRPDIQTYVPRREHNKAFMIARIWLAIHVATIVTAIAMQSILPLMVIGLPRLYGAWHHVLTGLLQHAALADNVPDHRLNSRTMYLNPISRFIYWNMNYHIEHHMFPLVPYHKLPELHERIKHDLPAPNTSIYQAVREALPVLMRQLKSHDDFLLRDLPSTAKPYRWGVSDGSRTLAAE